MQTPCFIFCLSNLPKGLKEKVVVYYNEDSSPNFLFSFMDILHNKYSQTIFLTILTLKTVFLSLWV